MKHIKTAMATEGSPLYAPEWAAIAKQDLIYYIILIIIVGFEFSNWESNVCCNLDF